MKITWNYISIFVIGFGIGSLFTENYIDKINKAKNQEELSIQLEEYLTYCDARLLAVLNSLDMRCLGEVNAADGEVILYPDWVKPKFIKEKMPMKK